MAPPSISEVVLVTGDREWNDWDTIFKKLCELSPGSTVIHGDARGADRIAGEIAKRLDFEVRVFPAQWGKFGRAAGPIRNQQMLDENPDITRVLAFHASLDESRGTRDMVKRAEKKGLRVDKVPG